MHVQGVHTFCQQRPCGCLYARQPGGTVAGTPKICRLQSCAASSGLWAFSSTIEVLHPPERSLKKEGKFFELQTDPIG